MTARAGVLAAALACAASAGLAGEPAYHHDIRSRNCCLVIAHAGGGIEGNAYTNSQEGLLANLKIGVRIFEIDFSRTQDGVWVGTHDWEGWKAQTGHAGPLPPSYETFSGLKIRVRAARYTAITIPFLEKALARHKDAVIVTDTKYDAAALAAALRGSVLFERIYPQAYSLEEIDRLGQLGYRNIILTLYKLDLRQPERLMARISTVSPKLHAVTAPLDFFAEQHKLLAKLKMRVYVHGDPARINSRELHARLRDQGAAGLYLD